MISTLARAALLVSPFVAFFVLIRLGRMRTRAGCIVLLACNVVCVVLIGSFFARMHVPGHVAYPLAGLIFFFWLVLVRKRRRGWAAPFRDILRLSERFDSAAARRAAKRAGWTFRKGKVSTWTDVSEDSHAEVAATVEGAAESFAQATGFRVREIPIRIILFQREESFVSYTRGVYGDLGRVGGYYAGDLTNRIVLCRQLADRVPQETRDALSHELGHCFLRSMLEREMPRWLEEGVATLVTSMTGGRLRAPGTGLRYFRAAHARGELLKGSELFTVTSEKLRAWLREWSKIGSAAFADSFYFQSGSFVRFLAEEHGEPFRRFLSRARPQRRLEDHFRRTFDLSPDEAMTLFVEHFKGQEAPAFTAPTDALKERIEDELVAPIRRPESRADDRLFAIRLMGASGYPWRADALIDVLEGPADAMRAEALRALENIAGELRGTDPRSWREWLRSLPAKVRTGSRRP